MKPRTEFSKMALLLLVVLCLVSFGGSLSSIAQEDDPGEDAAPGDTSPDDEDMSDAAPPPDDEDNPDEEPPPDDEDVLYKEPPLEEEDPEWEYDEGASEPGPTEGFEGAEGEEGNPTFGFEGSIVGVDAFSSGPVRDCQTNVELEPTELYSEIEYDPDAEPPHETEDIRSITLEAPGYESLTITEFQVMSISLLFVSINLIVPTQADLCMEPIEYDVEGVDYSQGDTFTYSAHVKKVLAGNKVEIEILNEKGEVVRTVIANNSSGKSLRSCQNIIVTGTPINVIGDPAGQPTFDVKSVVSNPKSGQHALTDSGMLEWDAGSKSWKATPAPSEGDYDYAGGKMYRFQNGKWTPVTPNTTYVDPADGKTKTHKYCDDVIARNGLFHCRGTDRSGNLVWSQRGRWYHCRCRRAINGIAHYSSRTGWTEVPRTTCTFAYVSGPKARDKGMWHFNGTSWVHHQSWTPKPSKGEYVFSTVDGRMYYYTGSRFRAIVATPCTYIMARSRTDKTWFYPYHFTDQRRWEIPDLVEGKWYRFKNGGWSQWTGRPKKEGESGWRDPAPGDANLRIEKVAGSNVNVIVEIADENGNFVQKHRDLEQLDIPFQVGSKWFVLETASGKYLDAKTGQVKEKQVYRLSEIVDNKKVLRAVIDR